MSINNYRHVKNLGGDATPTPTPSGEGRPLLAENERKPWWAFWRRSHSSGGGGDTDADIDGDKQIGTFGSVCLLINSITGPGSPSSRVRVRVP
jgi:hypothetical protein